MTEAPLHLFEAFGVELEYMIVDADSLVVRPITDVVMHEVAGEYLSEVELGEISWSNELALHVIELKTTEPAANRSSRWPRSFSSTSSRSTHLLRPLGARLMPTAMHPWMDPDDEMKLWPHEYNAVYAAYQPHLRLPRPRLGQPAKRAPQSAVCRRRRVRPAARGDSLLLPILPALAASSPVVDGRLTGMLDNRLDVYRTNCAAGFRR